MAISLEKGQRIEIGLQKVGLGLGWDPNDATGSAFDLDASAFLLGSDGKLVDDNHFVFYGNKVSPDGAVIGAEDDTTGDSSAGDDEVIRVDIGRLGSSVTEIMFTVTIHDYEARKQNFGQVRNSFIRVFNESSGEEIAKYELDEDFSIESAIEFGRLYRKDGAWKFEAIGRGYTGGLKALLEKYQR